MVGRVVIVLAMLLALTAYARPANSQEPPAIAPPLLFGLISARSFDDFEKAVEAVRMQYGDEDARYAEALLSTQTFAAVAWPRASVEAAIKKAQAIFERTSGPDSVPVARCMVALAQHYTVPRPWNDPTGNFPKATQLLERALDIYEANGLSGSSDAERAILLLGDLETGSGSLAAAEARFERALKSVEKTATRDHQRVLPFLRALAAVYHQQKRFESTSRARGGS